MTTTTLHFTNDDVANSRILQREADKAMTEWLASQPDVAAELAQYDNTDQPFEAVTDAIDATYSAYQLDEDVSALSAAAQEHVYYNVAHEVAHRPLPARNGIVLDDEHVRAYRAAQRRTALGKGIARRVKQRRYHDIAEIVLGKDGKLLGASRVATAHRKAIAADKKAIFKALGLKASQERKVTRYMAKHGVDVKQAVLALKLA